MLVVVVLTSCSADGPSVTAGSGTGVPTSAVAPTADGGTSAPAASDERYALLRDPTWELGEAHPAATEGPMAEDPPARWYAEYRRIGVGPNPRGAPGTSAVEGSTWVERVRLSGHDADLAEMRSTYASFGFTVDDATDAGRPALTVVGSETNPDGIVLDQGGVRVLLLSYELTVDELLDLAGRVEPADEAAWIAVGGRVT